MSGVNFEQRAMTDWPTLAVVAGFWGVLAGVGVASDSLPILFVVAMLGILGALYMSLQHEVIHGHPTRSQRLNWLLVGAPLGLMLPFSRYRVTHLTHHNSDIANPAHDAESFYVLPETWHRAGRVHRAFLVANRTLLGRMAFGPFVMATRGIGADLRRLPRDAHIRVAWMRHLVGSAIVLVVVAESPLPVWAFIVGFVYLGAALTSLRSFAEHRVDAGSPDAPRAAVVRAGWFFSLLYLNNNLHYTHHQLPGAAWFRLPELTRVLDSSVIVEGNAGSYDGYGEIARRYLLRPFGQPVHPLSDSISA